MEMLHILRACPELSFYSHVWTSDPPSGTQVWIMYDKVKTGASHRGHVLNMEVASQTHTEARLKALKETKTCL